jgi:23S rRNA (adenine2503-C2)-methyltransferase
MRAEGGFHKTTVNFYLCGVKKERLYGKTLEELGEVASEMGMPRHGARQMAAWLYRRGAGDIALMTDISAARRAALSERFEVGLSAPVRETVSVDGTKKYLFGAGGGADGAEVFVEAAMIPDSGRDRGAGGESAQRMTLCLSSQAGCRMGCAFCATGRQGLQRNLDAGEILNQFASLPERDALTNIVYMGMGEPLDNTDEVLRSLEILTSDWGYGRSPTRITVSTAGVAPALERFLAESRVHLAVSLHNPFSDERADIMPIERAYPIEGVVEMLRRHDFSGQRRVSFEYIVMSGLNDSPRHIAGLTKLLGGLSCRVNLIKFHKIPGSPFFSPPQAAMERLRDALTKKGIRTTIRTSRGEDIEAACGLLSTGKV